MNEIKIGEYTFNFNYPNGISKNDIQDKNIPVDVLASLNRWVEEPVPDGCYESFYQPMGVCSAKDGKKMHTIFRVRDISVNVEYEIEVEGYVKSLEQLPIDNVDNLELISRTELML